jgi:hypothetical protein
MNIMTEYRLEKGFFIIWCKMRIERGLQCLRDALTLVSYLFIYLLNDEVGKLSVKTSSDVSQNHKENEKIWPEG